MPIRVIASKSVATNQANANHHPKAKTHNKLPTNKILLVREGV